MRITESRLKDIINEELEVVLTNSEVAELFGDDFVKSLREFKSVSGMDTGGPSPEDSAEFLDEAIETLSFLEPDVIEALTIMGKAIWKFGKETGIPTAELAALVHSGLAAVRKIRGKKSVPDEVESSQVGPKQ
jgi:hypothetical protein